MGCISLISNSVQGPQNRQTTAQLKNTQSKGLIASYTCISASDQVTVENSINSKFQHQVTDYCKYFAQRNRGMCE
ncbi:unnamed protein product [Allacma fusca]|uniref:Uncharacterized protein n=1 Tax=Allacma fusca TaxID=39272 RepID=A0A8J2JVY0_9HEXA|nr:unnamed protein product [Allacma fusca]